MTNYLIRLTEMFYSLSEWFENVSIYDAVNQYIRRGATEFNYRTPNSTEMKVHNFY